MLHFIFAMRVYGILLKELRNFHFTFLVCTEYYMYHIVFEKSWLETLTGRLRDFLLVK